MSEIHRQLSDEEFLDLFEQGEMEAPTLSHEAHFRVAFIYLARYPFETALHRITEGIQRFDEKYGGGRKYHATVTRAYMLLIYQRMKRTLYSNWETFISENKDLLQPVDHLLLHYYRRETLFSDRARNTFLPPDQCNWS